MRALLESLIDKCCARSVVLNPLLTAAKARGL
jgi:hypothetical protein